MPDRSGERRVAAGKRARCPLAVGPDLSIGRVILGLDQVVADFLQAEDGIRDGHVTGVQTCALPIYAVELAAAGVDNFAHLVRDMEMSDALIATMNAKGIYVMPNLGTPERATHTTGPAWFEEPYLAGLLRDTMPADVIARMRASFTNRDAATAEGNRQNYAGFQKRVRQVRVA